MEIKLLMENGQSLTACVSTNELENLKTVRRKEVTLNKSQVSRRSNLVVALILVVASVFAVIILTSGMSKLYFSKNTKLMHVSAGGCGLTGLDVSKNTALKELHLQVNNIKSIDVSKLVALASFYISANDLTELDLSNNLSLTELHCHQNPNLKIVYLKQGQTIPNMSKDSWTEIRYK